MIDPNDNQEDEEVTGEWDEMSDEAQLWRWGGEDEEGSMAYRNKHNPVFPNPKENE